MGTAAALRPPPTSSSSRTAPKTRWSGHQDSEPREQQQQQPFAGWGSPQIWVVQKSPALTQR